MTQPKTDLAYLRSEKAKAEQKLRSCQHREKILERQMSELNRKVLSGRETLYSCLYDRGRPPRNQQESLCGGNACQFA